MDLLAQAGLERLHILKYAEKDIRFKQLNIMKRLSDECFPDEEGYYWVMTDQLATPEIEYLTDDNIYKGTIDDFKITHFLKIKQPIIL